MKGLLVQPAGARDLSLGGEGAPTVTTRTGHAEPASSLLGAREVDGLPSREELEEHSAWGIGECSVLMNH